MKKVLVIGSGGREHAIVRRLSQSSRDIEVFIAPGNGGTSLEATNVDISVSDTRNLVDFAKKENIDLTIVGPEDPLVGGIVDEFNKAGLRIFGPNKNSAQLEGSKAFTKKFLEKYSIPTAKYEEFDDYHQAVDSIKSWNFPLVIKADGLCAGKGVIICQTPVEAIYTLKDILVERKFGTEGSSVIIEEFLDGYETSVLCIGSGDKLYYLGSAKDYKKVGEGDTGPNTGGMGCFSPNILVDEETDRKIKEEIIPAIEGALKEEELSYNGILFIGFMITEDGPKVLEFNVRFGDPETQVILPRIQGDFYQLLEKSSDGKLEGEDVKLSNDYALAVIIASGGYPDGYKKNFEIKGIEGFDDDNVYLIHNGTRLENNKFLSNGGRVLSVVSTCKSLEDCREKVYEKIDKLGFTNSFYRQDIAKNSLL